MALRRCERCGQDKTAAHYIACKQSIIHRGALPICRECIASIISQTPENEKWNTVNKICQWADIPFVPEEWHKIYKGNGKDAFGVYAAIFREKSYETLDWQQYNDVYLTLDEENRVEDALPAEKERQHRFLIRKWGESYDDSELEYLENLHKGLVESQNIVGALNEDQALKLCKISLIIENKIRTGTDFSRDLQSYDSLAKLSNLTSKNIKDAQEFDSAGEVIAYLEKIGTKFKYYDDVNRDEVDFTIKNIKNWLRYLYVNESGVAEEIEQRIKNLSIAAQIEGENFDEQEFRRYQEVEQDDEEKEEFRLNID